MVLGAVNRTRAAESRIESCDNKSSDLNLKIRLLSEMHELLKREAHVLVQMRSKLLQQNLSGTKRFQEVYKRCEVAKQVVRILRVEILACQNERKEGIICKVRLLY